MIERSLFLFAVPMFLGACVHAQDSTPTTESSGAYKRGKPDYKKLPERVREDLGLGPDDMVIVIHKDGTSTLYYDEKKGYKEGSGESLKGRTIIDGYQVLITRGSPMCYSYTTLGGETIWYPSPPCPVE